ncbi:MAG: DEAD/DEAH box helicase [Chloroflexi bacterium AL-W]|nr:DEAD/DEAH box helicase [Chloroflexi bacterium AL-N1]NOK71054.1 DEAD/DEAH box helicase [Chloroflexi bacterium AL-N10]NOK72724.1 DEAD/DEAH box helicase [Chloroflexi bacterium AL-N5]NOK79188.1 DEAD/DEAH box helicase [Chloroflexi bacterium AL-W]NOK87104.1 DEAD/DEAH box helicase [Chloroflexi bacterium AL-N15]
MNAVGMSAFAAQNGHARWITSPILSLEDWQAMLSGNHARRNEVLRQTLERTITKLTHDLESQTLSALAWLVADRILDFRLAVPVNDLTGEFHSKFGIFTDNVGDVVSFEGSYNDSIQGTRNYESLKIFRSWEPYQADMVQHDSTRFERLWCDEDPNVRVYDLPEAARQHILKLRTEERPYPTPRRVEEQRELYTVQAQPHVPTDLYVRDYQEEAIRAWFEHACQGILEMATGTGKTITALTASARLYKQEGRLAVIIAVPYQHLVDQWNEEATAFGYESVLAYQSKTRWLDELNSKIIDFNAGYRHFISVIVTHTTFGSPEFQNSVKRLNGPTLLIADEVHHLGAERSRQNYPEHVAFRLALSATPDRWFDDTGTVALRDYFGETIFTFSLEQAIGTSLTPYYYHPHLVPLTDEELEGYEALSAKIARLIHREDDAGQQALKMLLIRRTELLNKAKNKLVALSDLVDAQGHIEHTLFYCAPGQIDEVLRLLGWEKGLLVHRFTAEEDPHERQQLLTSFASGDLQGLVAMKCLDEGVDVPSTRTAFFLASSSNPREFIQRRGRILRQAPGKRFSSIHDLIAVPPTIWSAAPSSQTFEVERNIVRRELERFKEFANPALNKHQALDVVWDIAKRYGLMDF